MKQIFTLVQELRKNLIEHLGTDEDVSFTMEYDNGAFYINVVYALPDCEYEEDEEDEAYEEDELGWYCPVTNAICDGDFENCPVYLAFEDGSSAKPGRGQKGGD